MREKTCPHCKSSEIQEQPNGFNPVTAGVMACILPIIAALTISAELNSWHPNLLSGGSIFAYALAVLAIPIGVICGGWNRNQVRCICWNCGHSWLPILYRPTDKGNDLKP